MTGATELRIDLPAIVANWRDLCARHPSGAVAAVVKADGYGLGAAAVTTALYAAGCRHVFTAQLAEAIALRPHLPDAMIAVLNGLWPGDAALYRAHGILPVLGSLAEVDGWAGEALLHVDTGMRRLGLDEQEVEALGAAPGRMRGIDVRWVMTHLLAADVPNDPANARQLQAFEAACARLGLGGTPRSLANSSGLFLGPAFGSALARPGAALYGINPTPGRPNPMRPTVRLLARILQTRPVGAGETVGYNGTWTATRPSVIGTVSVGYADGLLRSLSNRAEADFDGRRVPLVGRVSMDLATFDLTETRARAGDWLELLGPAVPVDEVASWAGTNGYEVLTSLRARFTRHYGSL